MATTKPQVRSLFATPLCVHFLPIAPEMNAELRPMIAEVERHRPTVDKPVTLRTCIGTSGESEPAVAVKGDIEIQDGHDRRYRDEVGCGHNSTM